MIKSIKKITCLILIFGLMWSGISAIGETMAFFSDSENSSENIFQIGVLDFSLTTDNDFAQGVEPSQSSTQNISISNEGTVNFKYKVSATDFSGGLCNNLILDANLSGVPSVSYSGPITSFVDHNIGEFSNPEDWTFITTLNSNDTSSQGEVCNFKFTFKGWQVNFPNNSLGFTHKEEVQNQIFANYWNPPIVLNEFLPNANVYPEFIELFNQTSSQINLDGFYIMADNNRIDITSANTNDYSGGLTTIGPNKWLVVSAGGDLLNNSSGALTLYNPNDVEIDYYAYSGGEYNINNNPGWTNNLVGYWPFDNDNVLDISGNNNHGINYGALFVSGKINKALSFDGSDYVLVNDSSSLEITLVTLEAWVKSPNSPGNYKYIAGKSYGGGWGSYHLYTGPSGGLRFYIGHNGGYVASPDAGTGIWDNNWHHIVGTYDGSSVKLYVDGTEISGGTISTEDIAYNSEDFYIGSYGTGYYFNGLIDEVKIYNRALDSDEVLEHYNAVGSGNSVPLDKSYARIPDGSPNWVDPFPTPGGPNILESTSAIPKVDSTFQPEEQDPVKPEPEEEIIDIPEEGLVTESEGFFAQGGETASSSEDLIEDLIVDSEEEIATESEGFSAQDGETASSSEEDIFEEINNETEEVINNLVNDNLVEDNSEEEVATESEGFSAQDGETTSSSEDLIIDNEEENIEEDQQIDDQEIEESSDQEDSEDILEKEPKEELKEEEVVELQKPEEQENNQAEDPDNEVSNGH